MSELTKQQIKGPDQFQKFSSRVLKALEKHRRAVNLVLAAALVLGSAYAFWDFLSERREDRARLELYSAQKTRQEWSEKVAEQKKQNTEATAKKSDKKDEKKKDAKAEPPAAPVDPAQMAQMKDEAIGAYKKVIQDFPGSAASVIATIQSSQMLLDDGRNDEAMQLFEKTKEPKRGQLVLLGAYLAQKGKTQAQKGDCENAVKTWERVYADPSLALWHSDTEIKAAVCYEKLNHEDKALELYKRVSAENGDSEAGRSAKKMLVLAEHQKSKEN